MTELKISAVGLPWYRSEDYPRILQIMSDADRLPAEYSDWLKLAENTERQVVANGVKAIRAIIDPAQFVIWCEARAMKRDSKARGQFAAQAAYEQFGQ